MALEVDYLPFDLHVSFDYTPTSFLLKILDRD